MTPVHPGEVLLEALEERQMTQAEFAQRMGLSTKHVNQIIKGKTGYSAEVALGMERVLGISADLWLGLLANYRVEVKRQEMDAATDAAEIEWSRKLPT